MCTDDLLYPVAKVLDIGDVDGHAAYHRMFEILVEGSAFVDVQEEHWRMHDGRSGQKKAARATPEEGAGRSAGDPPSRASILPRSYRPAPGRDVNPHYPVLARRSGTPRRAGIIRTVSAANTAKTRPRALAWFGPEPMVRAVSVIAMMPPVCRNIARRPEIAATWSGISCTAALFDGGPAIPMPTPQTSADRPSQSRGPAAPGGGRGISVRPLARNT